MLSRLDILSDVQCTLSLQMNSRNSLNLISPYNLTLISNVWDASACYTKTFPESQWITFEFGAGCSYEWICVWSLPFPAAFSLPSLAIEGPASLAHLRFHAHLELSLFLCENEPKPLQCSLKIGS